ncbi:hypothetical protein Tco_0408575 [Tanacetum coccineum]
MHYPMVFLSAQIMCRTPFQLIDQVSARGLLEFSHIKDRLKAAQDRKFSTSYILWKSWGILKKFKKLKRSRIAIVKVRWNLKRGPEFTWEREDQMKLKYPHLFSDVSS